MAARWALVASIAVVVSAKHGGASCSDDADCALNGACLRGHCACDRGWTGSDCTMLRLRDVSIDDAYLAPNGYSSWGMSVAHDKVSGMYHGFVSEFVNRCKLGSWATNSYINHVVASSPRGPWQQRGTAVPVWAHNPKVVYSPQDKKWVLFHIGAHQDPSRVKHCNSSAELNFTLDPKVLPAHTSPFVVHYSDSLDGPWTEAPRAGIQWPIGQLRTTYPDVNNCKPKGGSRCWPAPQPRPVPVGGIWLYEIPSLGNGKVYVPFSRFRANHKSGRRGSLAWDSCQTATFDNGHPVHTDSSGSAIGSMAVNGSAIVAAGFPCMLSYAYDPSHIKLIGTYSEENGTAALPESTDYFEVTESSAMNSRGWDASSCHDACQADDTCTSFTWTGNDCLISTDSVWLPREQHGAVSGRPWTFDGDNPAPYVDPASGEVHAMWRTDVRGGTSPDSVASLIGLASAPSWRGPYTPLSLFGGPISSPQYPYEENEDPFLWRSPRGWHALFHANTWGDSHSVIHPPAKWAIRHAFSQDGVKWTFSHTPVCGASILFTNGTNATFARMERPFLLFDDKGNPSHLFTGVQRYKWDDFSFTLMQQTITEQEIVV